MTLWGEDPRDRRAWLLHAEAWVLGAIIVGSLIAFGASLLR